MAVLMKIEVFVTVTRLIYPFQGKKVKESRNRPHVAQRVPGGLGSQIFMTFST
jgi:hypothetical protein